MLQRRIWATALRWEKLFPLGWETGLKTYDGEERELHAAWKRLASYEDSRTNQWWNSCHKRIRTMGDVIVATCGGGTIGLGFSLLCDGSSWHASSFMESSFNRYIRKDVRIPLKPEQFTWKPTKEKFPEFLNRCCDLLDTIVTRKN